MVVEDLIEVRPDEGAPSTYVDAEATRLGAALADGADLARAQVRYDRGLTSTTTASASGGACFAAFGSRTT